MRKPNFSIVLIAKNEENTIGRCLKSLEEFISRGGEVILGDTGSFDRTNEIAEAYGCRVIPLEDVHMSLNNEMVYNINNSLVADGEPPVFPEEGSNIFHFAWARNKATNYATNDFIISLDCDEVYTNLDIDYICNLIDSGVQQISYNFIYSHDILGNPDIQFIQSKAFDRRVLSWSGIVHEVLLPRETGKEINSVVAPRDKILLEHFQEPERGHRDNYLKGLALDVFLNPNNDRNTHYLAREFYYKGMYNSAINMFAKHIQMEKSWYAERAQSIIYQTDCEVILGQDQLAEHAYLAAFGIDPQRNLPLLRIAQTYINRKNYHAAIPFALMASQMKPSLHFYDERASFYEEEPFKLLYIAYGWIGDIDKAKDNILRCLEVNPESSEHRTNLKYYFTEKEMEEHPIISTVLRNYPTT